MTDLIISVGLVLFSVAVLGALWELLSYFRKAAWLDELEDYEWRVEQEYQLNRITRGFRDESVEREGQR